MSLSTYQSRFYLHDVRPREIAGAECGCYKNPRDRNTRDWPSIPGAAPAEGKIAVLQVENSSFCGNNLKSYLYHFLLPVMYLK